MLGVSSFIGKEANNRHSESRPPREENGLDILIFVFLIEREGESSKVPWEFTNGTMKVTVNGNRLEEARSLHRKYSFQRWVKTFTTLDEIP